MATLGEKNSRMRDFFDIRVLAEHESFEGGRLARAIQTTFERRGTPCAGKTCGALARVRNDRRQGYSVEGIRSPLRTSR